jgi:hypothetical protein
VDGIVWEWLKTIFTTPEVLQQAISVTENEQEQKRVALQERLISVNELLKDNRSQLERAINLSLTPYFCTKTCKQRRFLFILNTYMQTEGISNPILGID